MAVSSVRRGTDSLIIRNWYSYTISSFNKDTSVAVTASQLGLNPIDGYNFCGFTSIIGGEGIAICSANLVTNGNALRLRNVSGANKTNVEVTICAVWIRNDVIGQIS